MKKTIFEIKKQAEIAAETLDVQTARLNYAIQKLIKDHNVPEDCEAINQIRLVEAQGRQEIILQLNPATSFKKAGCVYRPNDFSTEYSLGKLSEWKNPNTSARFFVGERNPTCSADLILSAESMKVLSDEYNIPVDLLEDFSYREIFQHD